MQDVKTNGNWKNFDKMISEVEKRIAMEKEAELGKIERSQNAFERKRLSRLPLSELSWQDCDILNELKKSSTVEDQYADQNASNPKPEALQNEILNMCNQCFQMAKKNRPDLAPAIARLGKLLAESGLGVSNTNIEESVTNPSEKDFDSGVQKSIIRSCTCKRATDIKNQFY
jgi:hypothetical protein